MRSLIITLMVVSVLEFYFSADGSRERAVNWKNFDNEGGLVIRQKESLDVLPNEIPQTYAGCKKKLIDSIKSRRSYIRRFINLFLNAADVKDKDFVLNEHLNVKVNLEIILSGRDIMYLQKLVNNNEKEIKIDLQRIDDIFSGGLQMKNNNRGTLEDNGVFDVFTTIFEMAFDLLKIFPKSKIPFYLITFFISLCVVINCGSYNYKKLTFFLVILFNLWIILEGLLNYIDNQRQLEEIEELKYMSELEKKHQGFFERLFNFMGDDVSKVDTTELKKKTPLTSIIEVYGFYVITMPMKVFGSAITEFTSAISAKTPGWVSFLYYPVFLVMGILLLSAFILPTSSMSFAGFNMTFNRRRDGPRENHEDDSPRGREKNIYLQVFPSSGSRILVATNSINQASITADDEVDDVSDEKAGEKVENIRDGAHVIDNESEGDSEERKAIAYDDRTREDEKSAECDDVDGK